MVDTSVADGTTICIQWIQRFAHSELQDYNPVN